MGQLAKVLRILPYIQVIYSLIALIQTAERTFRTPGSGAAKKASVLPQFYAVLDALAASGLISTKVAGALTAGAEYLIDFVVQILKSADSIDPTAGGPLVLVASDGSDAASALGDGPPPQP